MRIGLAQVNTTVGDLEGNVKRCLDHVKKAQSLGADLVVFPEMTIPGNPPRDILFDKSFIQAVFAASLDLTKQVPKEISVLFGSLAEADQTLPHYPRLYNAAFLVQEGKCRLVSAKHRLPAHDVFHEPRWFLPGPSFPPFEIQNQRIGVLIGDDSWGAGYPLEKRDKKKTSGVDILVNLAASPYQKNILDTRLKTTRQAKYPIVYINLVGATDELIFDGRSFLLGPSGEIIGILPGFKEDLRIFDLGNLGKQKLEINTSSEEEIFNALSLGIHDFANKNQLPGAFLGLSGGVDSAVTACLAAEALGPERVTGISIPSRYTDPRSIHSARQLAESLGIHFEVVELEAMHLAVENTIPYLLQGTSAENVQARLRMLILMGYVNRYGGFLLNTSNKTELTCGYTTLYGDMAGTLSPLGDLTKPEVYALAREINRKKQIIPDFILERRPTAELKADQVDPFDYDACAPELENLVLENQSNPAMRFSEHKRWQMGIILKVSERAFGTGRLIPVTRH